MRRKHQKSALTLKVGHLYSIDWADHFSAKTTSDNPASRQPATLRTYGKLIEVTPSLIRLETERRTDQGVGSYMHEMTGIVKSCILNARDFGPDKEN
jgi:hypothetical protein